MLQTIVMFKSTMKVARMVRSAALVPCIYGVQDVVSLGVTARAYDLTICRCCPALFMPFLAKGGGFDADNLPGTW